MTRELFCYLAVKTNILYRLETKQVKANNHLGMIAPDENGTLACTCSQIHKKYISSQRVLTKNNSYTSSVYFVY